MTKAEAKVTDAEISKFYDEHKNLFEKADTGLMEEKGQKKDSEKPESPATKSDASGAKDAATEPKSTNDEKQATEPDNKKTTEPAPPDAKSSPAPKSAEEPARKDEKNKPEPADEKKSSPANEKKSSYHVVPSSRLFRLTALEKDAQKEDGAATDKQHTAENSTADKAAEKSAEKPEGKPAAGAEKPATSAGPAGPELKTGGAPEKPAETPPPAAPKKPVQYQPLSEVKDLIRRQLAETQVTDQLTKLTNDIHNQLDSDFNDWRFSEQTESANGKGELPAPPKSLTDLAPVAEKNGLKHGRTGPKSALDLRDMPIGKSAVPDTRTSLLSLLFAGHELDLYQPATTVDMDGNRYVSIKMSDTPARVPTLNEVRADVVAAWKKQKASELAMKRAEELAKKAKEARARR